MANLPNNTKLLILLCSPHAGGVTDRLGYAAASTVADAAILPLRNYTIHPCTGCGYCAVHGKCIYNDDTSALFVRINQAQTLLITAPIYFYALPAPFKAFIDRSQRFWATGKKDWPLSKKAGVLLVSGRPKGERLFAGALLTINWFLKPFCYKIESTLFLRGLDSIADLVVQPEAATQAKKLAHALVEITSD